MTLEKIKGYFSIGLAIFIVYAVLGIISSFIQATISLIIAATVCGLIIYGVKKVI